MTNNKGYSLMYVLFGLTNGEQGVHAETVDGTLLKDGHYFLLDEEVDPSSGPFDSRDEAEAAAEVRYERLGVWLFPVDSGLQPKFLGELDRANLLNLDEAIDEGTIVEVTKVEKNKYRAKVSGSYDQCDLIITGTVDQLVELYAPLLRAYGDL